MNRNPVNTSSGASARGKKSKSQRPDLASLLSEARVLDGSGEPIRSEEGSQLAAQEAKTAVQQAVANEVVRRFAAAGQPHDPNDPLARQEVQKMARGIVDGVLDAPRQNAQEQQAFVKNMGKFHAEEVRLGDLQRDMGFFESAVEDLEVHLKEGSAPEKLATLNRLHNTAQTFLPQADGSVPGGMRPELATLSQSLNEVVPNIQPVAEAADAFDQLGAILADKKGFSELSAEQRQELGEVVQEHARALKADGLNAAPVAQHLEQLARQIQAGDPEAGQQTLIAANDALAEAVEKTSAQVAESAQGAVKEKIHATFAVLAQEASEASAAMSEPAQAVSQRWAAMKGDGENDWGDVVEPVRALASARDAGALRELLGEAANDFSDADLLGSVSAQDELKARDLGLTGAQVQEAVQELRAQAVQEGRDPVSVDSVVALEALVGQARALEDLERNEPHLSQPEQAQSDSAASSKERSLGDSAGMAESTTVGQESKAREQDEPEVDEAELEMAAGD